MSKIMDKWKSKMRKDVKKDVNQDKSDQKPIVSHWSVPLGGFQLDLPYKYWCMDGCVMALEDVVLGKDNVPS